MQDVRRCPIHLRGGFEACSAYTDLSPGRNDHSYGGGSSSKELLFSASERNAVVPVFSLASDAKAFIDNHSTASKKTSRSFGTWLLSSMPKTSGTMVVTLVRGRSRTCPVKGKVRVETAKTSEVVLTRDRGVFEEELTHDSRKSSGSLVLR